jgi:HEAT repeat protein
MLRLEIQLYWKVEPLIAALNDKDTNIRKYSIMALGCIEDKRIVEPLIVILKKDKDSELRKNAARSLAINDSRAIDALINALYDRNSFVYRDASTALYYITKESFTGTNEEIKRKWQTWWDENKKSYLK